jgi:Predicted membrane protein
MNYWPLLGILLVVAGFALRMNPMLVVTASAIVTGLLGGMDLVEVIKTFGKAFNDNRIIAIVWIVLPVIGLLERHGLQQRAAALIRGFKNATTGRLLILYLIYRQITAAIGLHSTAGHPQTVRPLVAPMALAAAEKQHGELEEETSEKVKAYSAATDNVGLFFGEDIFFAIGSIVLIQQVLATYGYNLAPLHLAVWAIPTAIFAFLIHGFRLLRLDRKLVKTAELGE